MSDATTVLVPLLNPNEPDAIVVELMVNPGDHVSAGDVICALETSKSVEELEAEASGYVAGLVEVGAAVTAGDVLFYLAADPDWVPPEPETPTEPERTGPEGLKISDPARRLAAELGVDLDTLPLDTFVTENTIRQAASAGTISTAVSFAGNKFGDGPGPGAVASSVPGDGASVVDPTAVVIFGAGSHGQTLVELIRSVGAFRPVAVIDDNGRVGSDVAGVPVVGGREMLPGLRADGIALAINAIGGISNMAVRVAVSDLLAVNGFAQPVLVHPSAVVEQTAVLSAGAQVLAQSYVGSNAHVGSAVIVNTAAVVSHDCLIGDHSNLAPGCLLAGGVQVGSRTLLGMGVTTFLGLKIGSDVRAGNGAIINASVPDRQMIRGGSVWDG